MKKLQEKVEVKDRDRGRESGSRCKDEDDVIIKIIKARDLQ